MPLVLAPAAGRAEILADAMSDTQTWKGWAKEGELLLYQRRNGSNKRCWCNVDDYTNVRRFAQGGVNHDGHFGTPGEALIARRLAPSKEISIDFSPAITGLAFEVDPRPDAVIPAQPFRVRCQITDGITVIDELIDGIFGAPCLVARKCNDGQITQVKISVAMIDALGAAVPVDFAINKIDMIATEPLVS